MASSINILISPPYSRYSFSSRNSLFFSPSIPSLRRTLPSKSLSISASASASSTRALEALIFDCDGVILESEHLHRQAYNDAFAHFNVRCPSDDDDKPLNWSLEFYDVLQNQIGGGKPKMRWYYLSFSTKLAFDHRFWSWWNLKIWVIEIVFGYAFYVVKIFDL